MKIGWISAAIVRQSMIGGRSRPRWLVTLQYWGLDAPVTEDDQARTTFPIRMAPAGVREKEEETWRGEKPHIRDHRWDMTGGRLNLIMDSKMLADLLNGVATTSKENLSIICQRSIQHIEACIRCSLHPPCVGEDFCEWRPRDYNKLADRLCNIALDTGINHEWICDQATEMHYARANWTIYTDGGCRNEGISSYGWVIYADIRCRPSEGAYDTDCWKTLTIAMGYETIHGNHHSDLTEAWGVEHALDIFRNLLKLK